MAKRTERILALKKRLRNNINGDGYIPAGEILAEIDVAGAIGARSICSSGAVEKIVTRAMDKIEFTKPVRVGDILTCWSYPIAIGRTSIAVHVDVEVEREGIVIPTTQAEVVYVAIDGVGKPYGISCQDAGPEAICQFRKLAKITPNRFTATERNITPMSRKLDHVLTLRKAMMPQELNGLGLGYIFGGVLLNDMDSAGHDAAKLACTNRQVKRLVTRGMNQVEFKEPVRVNDWATYYGTVISIGETAVTVLVQAEVFRNKTFAPVTKAEITYVALDAAEQPVRVLAKRGRRTH